MWNLQEFALKCFLKKWSWREIPIPSNYFALSISKNVLCVSLKFIGI